MTIDDKMVCVTGLLFCDDIQFYIKDMIGTSRASKLCAVLDEASARNII